MTSQSPEVYKTDRGRFEITGYKIAEVRKNGVAVMIIGCDAANCSALHLHLLIEEEDGSLWVVTTLDSLDDEAVTRSGLLFRAIAKLVFDNYDVKNVMPGEVAPAEGEQEWEGKDIIPGLTPWSRA